MKRTFSLRSMLLLAVLAASLLSLTACTELQDLRQIKAIQDQRIYDLQRQLEQKTVDNDQLTRDNREFENRIRDLTDQAEAAKKDLAAIQVQVRELTGQVNTKTQTLTQIQASLDEKTKMAEDLANKTSQAQKELMKTREADKSREAALKEKEAALERLKKDLAGVQARSDQAANESEGTKAGLKAEADQLRAKIKKLESSGPSAPDPELDEAYSLLKGSLKPHIDAKVASVTRDPRGVVVSMTSDYVFKSGLADIDPDVHSTLDQIAAVYKKYEKKYVEVVGHADTKPIMDMPFADNLALASARATKVVRYLAKQLDPKHLKSSSVPPSRPGTGKGGPMDRAVDIILTSHP